MKLGKQCKNKVESSAKKYKLSTTKNTVTELENSIERFNNRLDQVPPLGPHKKKSE